MEAELILLSIQGNKRFRIPHKSVLKSWWRWLLGIGPAYSDILRAIDASLPLGKLRRVGDARLPHALLSMEEQQVVVRPVSN
jgi:hypothetical protein